MNHVSSVFHFLHIVPELAGQTTCCGCSVLLKCTCTMKETTARDAKLLTTYQLLAELI